MNIFYLSTDPKECAVFHIDRHVVKMILEYAQLLSTAHRVLDGDMKIQQSKSGRKQKIYMLPDERNNVLYAAAHVNHPSAKWTRYSAENYNWLFNLWSQLLKEYTFRYGKKHSSERLFESLKSSPNNISKDNKFCAPWRAMPEKYKADREEINYTLKSYRSYYLGEKVKMAKWTNRQMPEWFCDGIGDLYGDVCYIQHVPNKDKIISMPLKYARL